MTEKLCTTCNHCGWEPDSDLYCGHPLAFEKVSSFGATSGAMEREGLCKPFVRELWKPRKRRT